MVFNGTWHLVIYCKEYWIYSLRFQRLNRINSAVDDKSAIHQINLDYMCYGDHEHLALCAEGETIRMRYHPLA